MIESLPESEGTLEGLAADRTQRPVPQLHPT
jgi:hypothetical protein